ncbi:hypothetical protein CRE_08513 [Caenorhabditis remanei]|uniref:Uncharacterized protein n=1 Tax=Caenorhabditis remanei TaxID=31234 RepID=E3N6W0_CAERE|nr:hypothetical protein CRE_08513 [Caenorhabditis remanei]
MASSTRLSQTYTSPPAVKQQILKPKDQTTTKFPLTEEQRELLITSGCIPNLREIEAGKAAYIMSDMCSVPPKQQEEMKKVIEEKAYRDARKGKHPIPSRCSNYVYHNKNKILEISGCDDISIGSQVYANKYRYVKIKGSPESIIKARQTLDDCCFCHFEEEYDYNVNHRRTNDKVDFFLYVPKECLRKFNSNEGIRAAQSNALFYSTRVQHQMISVHEDCNPPIIMIGPGDKMREAKASVVELFAEFSEEKASISIPKNNGFYGHIIGTKGSTIRELSRTTGADIWIDKDEGVAMIEGTKKSTAAAQVKIQQMVKDYQDQSNRYDAGPSSNKRSTRMSSSLTSRKRRRRDSDCDDVRDYRQSGF